MNALLRFAIAGLAALPLHAASLARHPYLQNVGADHASILWTTVGGAGQGEAVLSSGGQEWRLRSEFRPFLPAETGLPEVFFLHRASFSGLTPGVRYSYSIRIDGADPLAGQPPASFRTASEGPFSFLVVGDSGDGETGQQIIARRMDREDVALILHTGDLAYQTGAFSQLESYFFSIYRRLLQHVPFFVVAGNHDYYDRDAAAYRASFPVPGGPGGVLYYSFDWGDVHFVALDTNTPLVEAVDGRGPMLRWLEQDLARTRRLWRIVFFHHLPFPNSHHKDDPQCALVAAHIVPILERQGVQLVFTGHEHNYQRTRPRRDGAFVDSGAGAVYITTGGGGAGIHPLDPDPRLAAGAATPHYVRVDVGDAELHGRAIDSAGIAVDEFRLSAAPYATRAVDAAAFRSVLAPGGLVAILGLNFALGEAHAPGMPLPRQLGGVAVLANGEELPLLYASRSQVSAQLPFHLIPPLTLRIRTAAGAVDVDANVRPAAPQVFRVGAGPAAIHMDGRPVQTAWPAAQGEWIAVFATGLGAVRGEASAGEAASASAAALPVRALVGQQEAEVSYAGLAPGFAGVYQINLRIPRQVSGPAPLRIVIEGVESEPVPIAITGP